VKIIARQGEEFSVGKLDQVGGEELAVAVGTGGAGHREGVVEPGHAHQPETVGLPSQLTDGVVAGDVIEGAELQAGDLKHLIIGLQQDFLLYLCLFTSIVFSVLIK
jgi:hypothetical protein